MTDPDARLNPYRDDLAAAYLRDRVKAPRYAEGVPRQVVKGMAPLRHAPSHDAILDSELLFGETVNVYEDRNGWAWVQNGADGYVGYVPSAALREAVHQPTHAVRALRTYLYPEPDAKAPPRELLSLASPVPVAETVDDYSRIAGGGWIFARHLAPLDDLDLDHVETARRFLGTPYLWGGRSSLGLDCSALVQLSLARAGIHALRDSDLQAETTGVPLPDDAPPARGDLIFFPEHVAIALDGGNVIHANQLHMAVTVEPLGQLEKRVRELLGEGITGIRRPGPDL